MEKPRDGVAPVRRAAATGLATAATDTERVAAAVENMVPGSGGHEDNEALLLGHSHGRPRQWHARASVRGSRRRKWPQKLERKNSTVRERKRRAAHG